VFKFIYARHKMHPKVEKRHEQWYLLIDNQDSFDEFISIRSNGLVAKYFEMKKDMATKKFGHYADMEKVVIDLRMEMTRGRKSVLDDCKVLDSFLEGYFLIFMRMGKFVVSPNYAFRHIDDSFEILDTVEKKKLIFPQVTSKDIKIVRWPNGKHYYASVGGQQVTIDGQVKWNTPEEATEKAEEFLKKNRRKKCKR